MSDPILELPFFGGLDESTRDELVKPGTGWPELVNVRADYQGALVKRPGFNSLTSDRLSGMGTARTVGYRLFSHNGQPAVIGNSILEEYSDVTGYNIPRGAVPECSARILEAPGQQVTDIAIAGRYMAIAYTGLNGAGSLFPPRLAIVEADTGKIIRPPEELSANDSWLTLVGSLKSQYFIAVVNEGSGGSLETYLLDANNAGAGWSHLATLATPTATNFPSIVSLSDRVLVAYGISSTTDRVHISALDETGVINFVALGTSSVTPEQLAIDGTSTLWVAWGAGNTVKVRGLNPTSLGTTTATETSAITAITTIGHMDVVEGPSSEARVFAIDQANATLKRASVAISAGAASATTMLSLEGVAPASRPFYQGTRHYIACYSASEDIFDVDDNIQGVCQIVDWTENESVVRPIANLMPGLVVGRQLYGKCVARNTHDRLYAFEVARSGGVDVRDVSAGAASSSVSLVRLNFADRQRWQAKGHDGRTFLGGGVTCVYDGESVCEVGFLVRPPKPTTGTSGTGITGTFRYVAVYEDVDTAGVRTVSGISDPSDVVSPSNKKVTVSTTGLGVTARIGTYTRTSPSRTRVVFYRTASGGEPPYYRLDSVECTGASSHSVDDTTADATLTTRAKLYAPNLPSTVGEALDRRAPPGLTYLESFNGMLVGCLGSTLYHSGQEVYGEATWFSPVFQQTISGGGDFTALKAQDGTLYAFKAASIYAVPGDAPTDNGMAGGLGTPRRLAVDVGCIEPSSVVATSLGIFFQSNRGIELLSRGGAVTPIGQKVQTTLASYPYITSAILDDRNGLVRFTLSSSIRTSTSLVNGTGRDLIFDLATNEWRSIDDKTGSSTHEASQDAAMFTVTVNGVFSTVYGWLGADGTLYYERPANDTERHLDVAAWVDQRAVTPWVAIAGLNGEQFIDQVLLLAKRSTDHDLTFSLAFDFSDSYTSTKTFTQEQIGALAREWLVKEIAQTTSQSVRVKLEDAAPSGAGVVGSGKGGAWVALSFNGQPHRGPKRTSGAQRGG